MKALFVLGLCFVAVQCQYGYRPRPNYDCKRICGRYRGIPVCSVDGRTYDNECSLECEWNYKECDGPCPCMQDLPDYAFPPYGYQPPQPTQYRPYAPQSTGGNNNNQGSSGSNRVSSTATTSYNPQPSYQQPSYQPAPAPAPSTNNGNSNTNQNRPVYGPFGCWCEPVYDPCCSRDNENYANPCEAECEGKFIAYKGRCMWS